MDRKQTIQNAYRLTGSNSFYDGMITCSTLPGKAVCRLVWAMNRAECESYLAQAREKALRLALSNVSFRQGDVGALPFADESFDIVLSLNGFHAFPDKDAAYRETFRVLKPGGTFCGCFYVAGEHNRTDWFIRHAYEPAKFFTSPYETVPSLRARLRSLYDTVQLGNLKSIAWFICRKAVKSPLAQQSKQKEKQL